MVSNFLMLLLPVILLLSSNTIAAPLALLGSASCLLKKLRKATCYTDSRPLNSTAKL
jgi:hypothetical protein